MSSPPAQADLRRHAARLRTAVTLLAGGTAALLLWSAALPVVFGTYGARPEALAEYLPSLVYLWGLFRLRGALAAIAAGELFGPAVERALRDIGVALVVGTALDILVLPNLLFWTLGPGHGGLLRFDVGNFCAGAMGAGLLIVARLVRAAAALRDELDGFL